MYTVLIVENNSDYCELLVKSLQRSTSARVETNVSGEEALKTLSQTSFNLVICDYKMNEKSGYEVFREWKSMSHPGHFILWTNEQSSDLPEFKGDGFLGVFKKVQLRELCEVVSKLVANTV